MKENNLLELTQQERNAYHYALQMQDCFKKYSGRHIHQVRGMDQGLSFMIKCVDDGLIEEKDREVILDVVSKCEQVYNKIEKERIHSYKKYYSLFFR